jgi:hypothetical protein
MSKLLPAVLVATTLLLSQGKPASVAVAGTCASNCGPAPIRFTPGQPIRIQAVNRTSSVVRFEQVAQMDPFPLLPGQELELALGEGTQPNVSLRFAEPISLPLRVVTSQPSANVLRVELYPGGRPPGDRAIYVLDDGRLLVQ